VHIFFNIVEQDHRFIKKKVRPTLGFKKFYAAQATIAGIEAVRMIKKGQLRHEYSKNRNAVEQFYLLAA
jgi:transposase-like protein